MSCAGRDGLQGFAKRTGPNMLGTSSRGVPAGQQIPDLIRLGKIKMTPEEVSEFEAKIRAFVGRENGPRQRGKDDVNVTMIRHWAEVLGDENPGHTHAEYAARSSKKGIVAPVTMLQIWSMEGYPMCQSPKVDVQRQLHNVFVLLRLYRQRSAPIPRPSSSVTCSATR